MKISIVFHSVCGNTYLMAKAFYESLSKKEKQTSVYRVLDDDWKPQDDVPPNAHKDLKEMMSLPVATPEVMLESDLILLGSPTYFGNVSAEMKAYMDSIAVYWFEAKLAGKKLAAFTSAGTEENGGDLCLHSICIFGHHLGMLSIPVPANIVPGESICPYGIVHYSRAKYAQALESKTSTAIDRYVEILLKHAGCCA